MQSRRDMRRNKLQVLLNKDSHGLNVGTKQASSTAQSALTSNFSSVAPSLSNTSSYPATSASEANRGRDVLEEIRDKYRTLKKTSTTSNEKTKADGASLRSQRQILLTRAGRQDSGSSLSNIESKELMDSQLSPSLDQIEDDVYIDGESESSKRDSGKGHFLKRPFAQPLRRWKDSRRKNEDMETEKLDGDGESGRLNRARALLSHIKRPKKKLQQDLNEAATGDVIDSSMTSRPSDRARSTRERSPVLHERTSSSVPPSFDIARTSEQQKSLFEPLSPLALSNTPASDAGSSLPDLMPSESHLSHPVLESQSSTRRFHSSVVSPAEMRHIERRLQELSDDLQRVSRDTQQQLDSLRDSIPRSTNNLDDITGLASTVRRLESELRDMEGRSVSRLAEQERRVELRLEKMNESFIRSLDAVADRVGDASPRNQVAALSTQEYILSWFVIGFSTILLPFGYLYHLGTSRCRKPRRRSQPKPNSRMALRTQRRQATRGRVNLSRKTSKRNP